MRNKDSHFASPIRQKSNCRRCGVCCLKGGPALHREDLPLLENLTITRSQLFTLCAGELALTPQTEDGARNAADPYARDSAHGFSGQPGTLSIQPLQHEIIKVKGQGNAQTYSRNRSSWVCVFYKSAVEQAGRNKSSGQDAVCLLHPDHPLECRLLDCRDPSGLLSACGQSRLSRADISSPTEQAIQQAHAAGLRWDILGPDLAAVKAEFDLRPTSFAGTRERKFLPAALEQAILEAARFDQAFRELLLERGKRQGKNTNGKPGERKKQPGRTRGEVLPVVKSEDLAFHLGRPVPELLQQFSLYISADARMICHRPGCYT